MTTRNILTLLLVATTSGLNTAYTECVARFDHAFDDKAKLKELCKNYAARVEQENKIKAKLDYKK